MNDSLNPKNRGLGRGLNALFEDDDEDIESGNASSDQPSSSKSVQTLPIEMIEANTSQPRRSFDEEALEELAASLKTHGMVQPVLVRPVGDEGDQRYEIIAGERRWRAAQRAQMHEVPVIVRDMDDSKAYQIALIENLQRKDLDPIDEARGYQTMIDSYGFNQSALAEAIGKSRPHIANMLRLLSLPESLFDLIKGGKLSAGHARALLTAKEPETLAKRVVSEGLSVRQTEKLAAEASGKTPRKAASSGKPEGGSAKSYAKDADTLALERDLSGTLGMAVSISPQSAQSGTVSISYKDLEQLDFLLSKLSSAGERRRLMS